MKKILFSLALVAAVSAVSIGGTIAYLSDTSVVEGNTISTGTVVLGNTHNLPFAIENLAPGGEFSTDLAIQYDGSLPADLYLGAKQESGMDLGPVLQYRLERMNIVNSDWEHGGWIVGGGNTWVDVDDPNNNILAEYIKTHSDLEDGDWARARLHVRMKDGGDNVDFGDIDGIHHWNDLQGIEESLTLILHAVQAGGDAPTDAPRDYNPQIKIVDKDTYSTIAAAVAAAGEDDTILVPQGVYEEALVLDKEGLTLKFKSEYGGTATIQSDTSEQEGVVAITADNVTLDGFIIDNLDPGDNYNNRAVRVDDGTSGTVIANNTFNNSLRGVQGNWTGDNIGSAEIVNNTFNTEFGLAGTENWTGLYVAGNTFSTETEAIGIGNEAEFVDHDGNVLAEGQDVTWLEGNNIFLGGANVEDYRTQ